jgi:hypothetical protein
LNAQAKAAQDDDLDAEELDHMSREELRRVAVALRKEKEALQRVADAISASGKQGSTEGMQISQAGPRSPSPPAASTHKSPRPSGVTFAQQPGTHRNSVLVVEFDNRKRSSVVQAVDQFR